MLATVIITIILGAIAAAIVINHIKKKKNGQGGCSCGCGGCAMSEICNKEK